MCRACQDLFEYLNEGGWDVLSARCCDFLRTAPVSSRVIDVTDLGGSALSNARLRAALNGVALPLFGGDLRDDWCLIGQRHVGQALGQGNLLRVAESGFAQCAIATSEDGRLGFSWAGEFLPRYSGILHFLESSAVWFDHRGWFYADLVSLSDPESVLSILPECEPIREASGEYVNWWMGDEYAIYAEPHIASPVPSPLIVSVLTKRQETALALKEELDERAQGQRPSWLLSRLQPVGDGHSELPSIWEPFVDQGGALRRFLDEASESD
jgi:hypothetical protein